MSKRKYEPWETRNYKITQGLRMLWLRSKERSSRLKAVKYCCEECGIKQSKSKGKEIKLEVHHRCGRIDWNKICDVVREMLLPHPDELKVLCEKCHEKEHENK